MATMVFSEDDEATVARVVRELHPARDELIGDCRELLDPGEWALLAGYARARVERSLRLALAVRAVVDALAMEPTAYAGRGAPVFGREVADACARSFAPVEGCWRLAPLLERLERVRDACVLADIATLEVLAQARLGDGLDEGLRALLG